MKEFFESNGIVALKADKSNEAPEVDALLKELGNSSTAIPYFGLFKKGEEPVHFDGIYGSPSSFVTKLGFDKSVLEESALEESPTQVADSRPQTEPASERVSHLVP